MIRYFVIVFWFWFYLITAFSIGVVLFAPFLLLLWLIWR